LTASFSIVLLIDAYRVNPEKGWMEPIAVFEEAKADLAKSSYQVDRSLKRLTIADDFFSGFRIAPSV
jgi:hypothetical protein